MATHSSILAWRIPWTEEPGGYSPWGCKESDMTEETYHARPHINRVNNYTDKIVLQHIELCEN